MYFVDLDREMIRVHSKKVDGFYAFPLGEMLSVTTRKSKHDNKVLSANLGKDLREDKFMLAYSPTNLVYFTEKLIHETSDSKHVSLKLQGDTQQIFVGAYDEYPTSSGIISFSHNLSLNNKAVDEKYILASRKSVSTINKKIKILAVALNNDKLFGLFCIPNSMGVALSVNDTHTLGISPRTLKVGDCSNHISFGIGAWFTGSKINEL